MDDEEFKLKVCSELAAIKTQGNNTYKQLENHLKHHWAATLAILGGFFGLLGLIVKFIWFV